MAYLITQPLYLFVMKLIVIYDSLCTICSMSHNKFCFLPISAFLPGAAGGGSKREDGLAAATMTRNQISGGKQMEGQMDRDCETSAAVSQVY